MLVHDPIEDQKVLDCIYEEVVSDHALDHLPRPYDFFITNGGMLHGCDQQVLAKRSRFFAHHFEKPPMAPVHSRGPGIVFSGAHDTTIATTKHLMYTCEMTGINADFVKPDQSTSFLVHAVRVYVFAVELQLGCLIEIIRIAIRKELLSDEYGNMDFHREKLRPYLGTAEGNVHAEMQNLTEIETRANNDLCLVIRILWKEFPKWGKGVQYLLLKWLEEGCNDPLGSSAYIRSVVKMTGEAPGFAMAFTANRFDEVAAFECPICRFKIDLSLHESETIDTACHICEWMPKAENGEVWSHHRISTEDAADDEEMDDLAEGAMSLGLN